MMQQAISFSFPLFSFIFSIVSVSAQNSNIYIQCSKSCFASMTPYESNVISLFTSLVNSAAVCNFNKFAICPPGYSQNNSVYGLFQCRGDLSSSDCKECVMSSITQLKATCPVSTGGAIQLDECFVKYDNISFFGDENRGEVLKRCGPPVGYNSDVLSRIDSALAYLIAGNGKYFRACDYGGIQGVAQCVQDLSVSDCQDCLSEASGKLRSECAPSTWGGMYLGKCFIRYADQVNGASKQGSKHNSRKLIGYIVGGSIAGVILILAFTLSLRNSCNLNIFKKKIKKIEVDLKGKAKEIEANKNAVEVNQRATEINQKAIEVNKRGVQQNRQSIEAISRTVAENRDGVEQNSQSIEAIRRTVAETRDGVEQNEQSIEAISRTVAETRDGVEKARRLACEAKWKAHEAMRYAYYDRSYCHHGCVGNCHRLSCKTIPLCLN